MKLKLKCRRLLFYLRCHKLLISVSIEVIFRALNKKLIDNAKIIFNWKVQIFQQNCKCVLQIYIFWIKRRNFLVFKKCFRNDFLRFIYFHIDKSVSINFKVKHHCWNYFIFWLINNFLKKNVYRIELTLNLFGEHLFKNIKN